MNPNMYQDMDLNVYEEDDDETLHRKLILAKMARKKAEEDHRLLSNRIALLKQEEQKAWKKFDETKKRTNEILVAKQRNKEIAEERAERLRQKQEEEYMRRQISLQYKETIKANVDATKRNHDDKLRREVENLKNEKREQKDFMHVLRHQEQIKNH